MVTATALAGPDIMEKENACFGTSFKREDGPIKEMTVRIHTVKQSGDTDTTIASIGFTEWDVPNQVFEAGAYCTLGGGKARCSIECDGGHAILMLADDGRMFVETSSLRNDVRGDGSLLAINDADGGSLTGIFALTERPGVEACHPEMDRRFAELAAGDISLRVKDAEAMLNRLGQFLEFPDTVFDETTTLAVTNFQRQYGLNPDGIINEETARILTNVSRNAGGC